MEDKFQRKERYGKYTCEICFDGYSCGSFSFCLDVSNTRAGALLGAPSQVRGRQFSSETPSVKGKVANTALAFCPTRGF
jgi:hypothetical protein